MSNCDVVKLFLAGKAGHTRNLVSTGTRLLSYGYYEIAKYKSKNIIVKRKGKNCSMSTAKHRGLIWGPNVREAKKETPVEFSTMEF